MNIQNTRTSPRRIAVAERRAQALQLRAEGCTMDEIRERVPGYRSRGAVAQDIQRAMIAMVAEPTEEVRALEVARLDMLWVEAMLVLRRQHVTVSNGKVVHLDGRPVQDDGPALAAIDRLVRIAERRAKLLGLDAPTKVEVITLDAIDAEIRRLTQELDRAEAAQIAAAADAEATPG